MAKHEVTLSLHDRKIERGDVIFRIKVDGVMLGRLCISQGGVEWKPKHAKITKSINLKWNEFAALIEK